MPDFDAFLLLDIKKGNKRSHGKRKNGNFTRKHKTVLSLFYLNILLNSGRHQILSKLASMTISSLLKNGKRKVQGVPHSQTAALPRPQEEETDNLNKHKPNKRTKSTNISSLFPKRGNRNTKRTKNTRTKRHTERHTTNRLVE